VLGQLAVSKAQLASSLGEGPVSDVDQALNQGFAWLRFPPALEARFMADKAEQRLLVAMVSGLAITVLFTIPLFVDWCMTPDVIGLSLWMRLVLYPCVTLSGLQFMRKLPIPVLNEWLMAAGGMLAIGIEMVLLGSSQAQWAIAGVVILNLIAVCTCSITRFWPAVVVCLSAFLAHSHLVSSLPDPTQGALPFCMSVLLLSSLSFALYGNYKLEHGERMAFLLDLREARLDNDLHVAHAHIERMATTDALTGLANRRNFEAFLAAGLQRAQVQGLPLSLIVVDIDYFKRYNDRYGHQAGDACLVDVAQTLSQSLRRTGDLVARWGGEEFVVVMVDADAAAAQAAAERMRQAVLDLNLTHAGSQCADVVSVSMGLSSLVPDRHTRTQDVCSLADEALYMAKAQGRNQVCQRHADTSPVRGSAAQRHTATHNEHDAQPAAGQHDQPKAPSGAAKSAHTSPREGLTDWRHALRLLGRVFSPKVWHPHALRFEPARETRFQEATRAARLSHFMVSGGFALIVYNLFLLTDRVMVPDAFDQAVLVRFKMLTPLALMLLCIGHFGRTWCLRLPAQVIETTMTLTGVFAALSLGWLVTLSHNEMALLYPAGLVPILIYGNIIQRFRFGQAQAFSAVTVIVALISVFQGDNHPEVRDVLSMPLVLLVAFMAMHTLVMNYRMESDERRRFLTGERDATLRRELVASQARLETLARQDALTGVPNRRHADAYLQQHWQTLKEQEGAMGLLLLDVDHFKAYNDRHGHPAGDQCLQHVAKVLAQHSTRPQACLARWGGEEFIVILPGATGEQALQVAQVLQQAVQATALRHEASPTAHCVTVSIGAASCRPLDPSWTIDGLIAQADQALYQAKAQGRNRCVLAAPD
jgi:diguanylate cyclase (GGDEF)-like protein